MDNTCTFDHIFQLDMLLYDLRADCYALHLLVQDDEPDDASAWSHLLADRVEHLEQTYRALFALEQAMENKPAPASLTPAAASDTPSA